MGNFLEPHLKPLGRMGDDICPWPTRESRVSCSAPPTPLQFSCLGHSPTWEGSADACAPSWQHTLLGPQHLAPHQVSKRGSKSGNSKEKGKLCPLKPEAILGLVSKKSQQSLAAMGPPLWTFVPPSDHAACVIIKRMRRMLRLHPVHLTSGPLHSLAPGTAQQLRG